MPFFKKKESLTSDERLLGTWRLVKSDGTINAGNGVTLTFMANGRLLYVIHEKQSDEIMNLSFVIDGDCLVTNQSSRPQMESTKFSFDADDRLVLDYSGSKSWFARA
jgi:6-phosphogluconolactonase (cycloisomerase 2 family)